MPGDERPDSEERRHWARKSVKQCCEQSDALKANRGYPPTQGLCVAVREGWASVLQFRLYDGELALPLLRELAELLSDFRDNIWPKRKSFLQDVPEPKHTQALAFMHSVRFRGELLDCLIGDGVDGLYEFLRRELEDQFGLHPVVASERVPEFESTVGHEPCDRKREDLVKSAFANLRVELANYSLELAREKGPFEEGAQQQLEIGNRLITNASQFVTSRSKLLEDAHRHHDLSCPYFTALQTHLTLVQDRVLSRLNTLKGNDNEAEIAVAFSQLGRETCELRNYFQQVEILDTRNMIPDAPSRPSGQIRVQLKKRENDQPTPAEDPWAN